MYKTALAALVLSMLLSACATESGLEANGGAAVESGQPVQAVAALPAAHESNAVSAPDASRLAMAPDFQHCLVNWSGAIQSYLTPWTEPARQCDTRRVEK